VTKPVLWTPTELSLENSEENSTNRPELLSYKYSALVGNDLSQDWELTGAVKTLEQKLAGWSLHLIGQRPMLWSAAHVRVERVGDGARDDC
jgi:hypothetical protein